MNNPAHKMHEEAFLNNFPYFVGKLLHAATATHVATPDTKMPPSLASLWLAAGACLGLTVLTHVVQHSEELQQQLETYSDHPFQEDERNTASSRLSLGTTLRNLSKGLAIDAEGQELQQQYTFLLERLEEDFKNLLQERQELGLAPEEHTSEIQELFAKTLYSLTRLQRV